MLDVGKTFSESQPLDGIRLDLQKVVQIVKTLCEGVGVRATARLTGVDKNAVLRVLRETGSNCARLLDDKLVFLKPEPIEID